MRSELKKYKRSFRYAYEGIKYALITQHNMKFHFFISLFVLIFALFLNVSHIDILFILLAITLVIVTELINTAIEKTVDLAMPERHPFAKIAKDVAAAAVLVAAIFAVTTGMIVFYAPISNLIYEFPKKEDHPVEMIWIILAIITILMVIIQARFSSKNASNPPSLITAVAGGAASLCVIWTDSSIAALLSIGLAFMVGIVVYDKQGRTIISLLLGGLLGALLTLLCYDLIVFF